MGTAFFYFPQQAVFLRFILHSAFLFGVFL